MVIVREWKVVKTEEEIELMRRSARVVAETLRLLGSAVKAGITTKELDQLAEDHIRSRGGLPSFKGYRGFPATICASVNSEVVHGIPGPRRLEDGDIISIDVGVLKEGYHGDGAATFAVGTISEEASRLLETTRQALEAGIAQARAGNRVRDISQAVQGVVEAAGFSVVRDLVGHGIGQQMHEEPQIPNFVSGAQSPMLAKGMTLAIEPMVNAGAYAITVKDDAWTVVTSDGSLSAHFEHTVAVTDDGAETLTVCE
ncbi:MAG TPA: type I methionyl aminopeptidase [bacterium]|nr:type I methionyl aminopeptidase [bacterium]